MNNEKYQLRYLPIFFEDVKEIVLYIKNELSNEKAANDLIDAVENAILQRLPVCESFEPYHSKKERKLRRELDVCSVTRMVTPLAKRIIFIIQKPVALKLE